MEQNQAFGGTGASGPSGSQPASGDAVEDLKERLGSAAEDVRADAQEKIVEPVKDALRSGLDERKKAGAEQMHGVAHAIRSAADELSKDLPETAGHIRNAAHQIERLSAAVRERSVEELFHEFDQFAHRQPLAVFGGSLLAGFALSRFLKSSAPDTPSNSAARPSQRGS